MRLAARTRESVLSSVDHLCLHTMVRALDAPDKAELRKLMQLKEELGELVRLISIYVDICISCI